MIFNFKTTGYRVQYAVSDVNVLIVGLYNTTDIVFGNYGLYYEIANGTIGGCPIHVPPSGGAIVQGLLDYFGAVQTAVEGAPDTSSFGHYMIRSLSNGQDKQNPYTTTPLPMTSNPIEFYAIPDGVYKVFAAAIRDDHVIGLAVSPPFDVNPAARQNPDLNTPVIAPPLSITLDPDPAVSTTTTITPTDATPSFGV